MPLQGQAAEIPDPDRPHVLVVGTSARLLAQAARVAGYAPIVVDAFGDLDTRRIAVEWLPLSRPGKLTPDRTCLLSALDHAGRRPGIVGWIAGSGFEGSTDLLAEGARHLPLIGNSPDTITRVRTPGCFFSSLAALGIAAPETSLQAPAETTGWLFKDAHASGGWHIRPASRVPACPGPGTYYQRQERGMSLSALFVADGADARVVGIARQIVAPLGSRPYVYRGCIGPITLDATIAAQVARIANQLTRRFELRGLNGIDFLLGPAGILILELNPRPTASLALFDESVVGGLIAAHVMACTDRTLPAFALPSAAPRQVKGVEVVFARRRGDITPAFAQWLAEQSDCHDLPAAGSHHARYDPVCSISAQAHSVEEVLLRLSRRRDQILARLNSAFSHAPEAFRWACFMDVATFKPGNVSIESAGHDMQARQFLDSAAASTSGLFNPGAGVGARAHAAVRATRATVGCNTNLGIILLCAPIARAVEEARTASRDDLQYALDEALETLDLEDAQEAFAAIAHANPGGLGQAESQDVHAAPSVGLREAMQLAAARDFIAAQYANGYAEVFHALARFQAEQANGRPLHRQIQRIYLDLLARHRDSHLARKFGPTLADVISAEAAVRLARFNDEDDATLDADLHDWDSLLKQRGLNPGTTADLTVCVLFLAALLRPELMQAESPDIPKFSVWNGDC